MQLSGLWDVPDMPNNLNLRRFNEKKMNQGFPHPPVFIIKTFQCTSTSNIGLNLYMCMCVNIKQLYLNERVFRNLSMQVA